MVPIAQSGITQREQGEGMANRRRKTSAFAKDAARMATAALCVGAAFATPSAISPAVAQEAGIAAASVTPRLKPPAPAPQFISRDDLARIEAVRDALGRKRHADARRAAEHVEQPIARSLALWYYFDAQDPLVSMADAKAFLDAHPDWPSLSRIQAHAEENFPPNLSARDVLDFFDQRDPVTTEGKMALASALIATGSEEGATARIRDSWRHDAFTLAEERDFLQRFGRFIRTEDHIARADDLLFKRQVTNARRVFSRLPAADRRKAEVRAELLLQATTARRSYDSLGDEERIDRGVLHAALRHYRRADYEARAMQIARAFDAIAAADPVLSEGRDDEGARAIWNERNLLMRYALKEKLYSDAYAMAAGHGLAAGSTDFSEAEFNAGWIALRFLNDPARARVHFAALTASVGSPISLARGYYWLGRADEAAGDGESAERWYAQAAEYPYVYYGQLAAEKMGGAALEARFEGAPGPSPEEKAAFAARPAAQALRMLSEIGDQRAFLIFGYHLDDRLASVGEFIELADAAARLPAPHVTVRAGKAGAIRGVFAPQVSYPTIFVPDDATQFAPVEVILGLSRQESEFNPRAYSRVGARGLMQLMPATAKITANKERIHYQQTALLDDPNYNMLIGSAHLSHLLKDVDGSWPMVFAGYNAGIGRVNQWVEAYGDPRRDDVDPIDWIEQIPFSETRNYVQRVLENVQVYRSALSGAPLAGRLALDIESGGPTGRAGKGPAITSAGYAPDAPARIVKIADAFFAAPPPAATAAATAVTPAAPVTSIAAADANAEVRAARASARKAADPSIAVEAQVGAGVINAPAASNVAPASVETKKTALAPDAEGAPAAPLDVAAGAPTQAASGTATDVEVAPQPIPVTAKVEQTADARRDECFGYAVFIASADPENASAQDLNAGVLAELTSGGGACETGGAPEDLNADAEDGAPGDNR
ncbi:MAG: transglycosylase SLT domain-containing protein [Alphaproteobacteria bacterium]|nr:transglycosylase SLT domain-containing protein [Alphaproteobacteria bacterium]